MPRSRIACLMQGSYIAQVRMPVLWTYVHVHLQEQTYCYLLLLTFPSSFLYVLLSVENLFACITHYIQKAGQMLDFGVHPRKNVHYVVGLPQQRFQKKTRPKLCSFEDCQLLRFLSVKLIQFYHRCHSPPMAGNRRTRLIPCNKDFNSCSRSIHNQRTDSMWLCVHFCVATKSYFALPFSGSGHITL